MQRIRAGVAVALLFLLTGAYAPTQSQSVSAITPPSAEFGANIGDDYFLANYTQLAAYWQKLDAGVRSASTSWRSARPPRAGRS